MLGIATLLLVAQAQSKVDVPTLEYYQEQFVVRTPKSVLTIPRVPSKPEPKRVLAFRRNDDYAVWDERGLTVRRNGRSRSSFLEDLPVSPKLFTHDEIQHTIDLIHSGERTKKATALSGALRVGREAYFLVRWESSNRKPWSEALVRVSLAGKDLWPEVVGRFEGISLGYKPIDDRLFLLGDELAVVTRKPGNWGVATYSPKTKQFDFHRMGDELMSFISTGRNGAVYVEKTPYGPLQAGLVDVSTGERSPLFEARASTRFLDADRPLVVVSSTPTGTRLHNAQTGAEWSIPPNSGIARAGGNILVWTPAAAPKTATLYNPERWTTLAKWTGQP